MITIHTTGTDTVETIQQRIDAAMQAKHLRETRQPVPNPLGDGVRLSGETIRKLAEVDHA